MPRRGGTMHADLAEGLNTGGLENFLRNNVVNVLILVVAAGMLLLENKGEYRQGRVPAGDDPGRDRGRGPVRAGPGHQWPSRQPGGLGGQPGHRLTPRAATCGFRPTTTSMPSTTTGWVRPAARSRGGPDTARTASSARCC